MIKSRGSVNKGQRSFFAASRVSASGNRVTSWRSPYNCNYRFTIICSLTLCFIFLSSCANQERIAKLRHFNISVSPIPSKGRLTRIELTRIDTGRVAAIIEDLGKFGLNEEMKCVGSSRSVMVSEGPVFLPTSYLTHVNDYMRYIVSERAKLEREGSNLHTASGELSRQMDGGLVFSFVLESQKLLDLKQTPVVLINSYGQTAKSLSVIYTVQHINGKWVRGDIFKYEYRYLGKFVFPAQSQENKPMLSPDVTYLKITLLPGNSLQFFLFELI